MPACTTRRLIPFALAVALVLAPVSFAGASPVMFDASAVQTVDQGSSGFFSWITGWFQDLVSVSDAASNPPSGAETGPPQPSDGLTDSTEEGERGPALIVEG